METLACDVLVIGAGPAGSTAARAAAENGARTILMEARAEIGLPVHCAGYVSQAIRWLVDLRPTCIAQYVAGIRTCLPDGFVQEKTVPGYTLHRALFDKQLAEEATRAGARLLLGTRAIDRQGVGVIAQRGGQRLVVEVRVIVGADGPRSIVARWMGLAPPRLARAVQHEVVLGSALPLAEIYFDPVFRGGYGWLFPAGKLGRVGAAFVGDGRAVAVALDGLLIRLEEAGRFCGPPISTTSGFVPVGGPLRPCREDMMLAGDAAGHAHPITGAGIVNAIAGGEMAGRAAARAALAGDPSLLSEYEEEWDYVFGSALGRAAERRISLERHWSPDPIDLSAAITQSWPLFDEYYHGG